MHIEDNPYEGIFFFPSVERFSATIGSGKGPRVIGYFSSLQEAIEARKQALKPGWQAARETATLPRYDYETRESHV